MLTIKNFEPSVFTFMTSYFELITTFFESSKSIFQALADTLNSSQSIRAIETDHSDLIAGRN